MNESMSGGHFEQRAKIISQPSHRSGWSIVLVFACIALGFVASVAEYERMDANTERESADSKTADSRTKTQLSTAVFSAMP